MVPDPRRRGGCSNAAIQQNSNNIGEWTRLDEGFRILGGQGSVFLECSNTAV